MQKYSNKIQKQVLIVQLDNRRVSDFFFPRIVDWVYLETNVFH
jgi:hypothetical protein